MEGALELRDNRIHERINCRADFTCRSYYNTAGEQIYFEKPVSFEIINLSVGGVLAMSNSALEEDMVLQYTFYLEDVPYVIMSRIKWQEKIAGGYMYGLEFLTTSNMLHRHLHEFTNRRINDDNE